MKQFVRNNEYAEKTKNMVIITRAIGDYEGYAVLVFKNTKDLYDKVHQIKSMPEIGDMAVSFTTPIPMNIPPNAPPKNISCHHSTHEDHIDKL